MSQSILIHENGGPEKMQFEDVEVGKPGPGQVKLRHTAIGLNFIDVYTRSGLYQTPLPNAVGREAAGGGPGGHAPRLGDDDAAGPTGAVG